MDSRHAKTEAEWWASREIESLRQQLADMKETMVKHGHVNLFRQNRIEELEQQLAECQAELKQANESLTVAYMSGFHDGKKKGKREALLEAANAVRKDANRVGSMWVSELHADTISRMAKELE